MEKINLKEAINLSHRLAEVVSKTFSPDIIIFIKDGGILPGLEMSEELGKPFKSLNLKRVIDSKFEKQYSMAYRDKRVRISKAFDKAWLDADPKLLEKAEWNLTDKNILLVDDAAHTGKTLDAAKKYLSSFSPKIIKTATLFYADKYVPDYFLGHAEKKYPWSTWARFDDKDYQQYEDYLKDHKVINI